MSTDFQNSERFIAQFLKKIATSQDGWDTVFIHDQEGTYWELTYPDSAVHGGGKPHLKQITEDVAKKKYSLS